VDIREGIENYVSTVNELFSGGNKGKLLLKLGDMPN
jgi:NADPH-dependent curcumin reductase CurA